MKTTDFIRIGHLRFDLNRIHRYWAEGMHIVIDGDGMKWRLSFENYADRDAALAFIDTALIEPLGHRTDLPASIGHGEETLWLRSETMKNLPRGDNPK